MIGEQASTRRFYGFHCVWPRKKEMTTVCIPIVFRLPYANPASCSVPSMKKILITLLFAGLCLAGILQAAGAEGALKPHLGKPHLDIQQVFKGERFGNIVVTMKGTIVATWGTSHVRAKRSEDGGKTWGPEIVIAKPGFQCGGLTVDESSGDILAFVEDRP